MKTFYTKGLSTIEILIAIAILAVLVAVTLPTLTKFRSEQALKNSTEDLMSLLNQARFDTQASLNSTNYSVFVESDRATYFVGSSYSAGASTNKQITFNPAVTIPASGGINLTGGGSIVTFDRLSGDTSQYGTIVIQLSSDATRFKTITIKKTGTVSSN